MHVNQNPEPLSLVVVTGSVREGRHGPTVTRWFAQQATTHPAFEVHAVDLADLDLTFTLPRHLPPVQQDFLARIDRADAVVVVVPEYNHGYPASLKQAIDIGRYEWRRKPVGIVSYGARSGGIRAAEQLRQVFPELEATTIRESIAIRDVWDAFDEDGRPRDSDGMTAAARGMLDQLAWWAAALRSARQLDAIGAMST
jgi:NAD(P)H-dependent FMN reductase